MPTQVKLTPQNFELVSGNDKKLLFAHKDESGNVVDITGATLVWALSKTAKSKTTLIKYTSPTNISATDPVNGAYQVEIANADTESLTPGQYHHEVRITSAAGLKHTAVRGTVEVLANVIDT